MAAFCCIWVLGCGGDKDICSDGACAAAPVREDAGIRADESYMPQVVEADDACAKQSIHAEPGTRRPVDIVIAIDNSGSMAEEISAVRENIDKDLAAIIAASGVDYRVIMLSQYGVGGTSVCIAPPLAGAGCAAGLAETNGDRYFHYNQAISSHDALCQILDTLDRPEPGGRAPHGFQDWLRPNAAKAFVLITDDGPSCSYRDDKIQLVVGAIGADPFVDAAAFHTALRAKAPEQFGGHYQFFSIVGIAPKGTEPEPLFPQQPLTTTTCDTAESAGLAYQALSIVTDALRYPVCEGRSFDDIFRVLAQSVIQTASAECTFGIPTVPLPDVIFLPSVGLKFRPEPSAEAQPFQQVTSIADCHDDHSFYIGDRIELCPDACRTMQRAKDPQVDLLYGCSITPD